MDRREFLKTAAAGAAVGGLTGLLGACERRGPRRKARRRVVVLAAGGIDAGFLADLVNQGQLPNIAALARQGTFAPLATTTPAEAEVAWATFASGATPGRNGIFGRFGRDAQSYRPRVADVAYEEARFLSGIPVVPPRFRSMMCREPFWRLAADEGVATLGLWAPADFPPRDAPAGLFLAGPGVPDAYLGAGDYQYFCSNNYFPDRDTAAGGRWRRLARRAGKSRFAIEAPAFAGGPAAPVYVEVVNELAITIAVAGQTQQVTAGTFSPYFSIPFGRTPLSRCRALARFFVLSVFPSLRLYVPPLEMDPRDPAVPISAPASFAADLAAEGPFATRGAPLDFGALWDRVIPAKTVIAAHFLRAEERLAVGLAALRRVQPDLLVWGDGGIDALAHVMWRFYDPAHPAYSAETFYTYADALPAAYVGLDRKLGKLMRAPECADAAFVVVSAHGQRPFRRSFDLNRWLAENGYLKLAAGATPTGVAAPAPETALARGRYRPAIDWAATRAWAQGFGQIYLNRKGRERRGTVAASAAAALKDELRARLLAVADGGRRPVAAVDDGARLFRGVRDFCAPDLVVSFAEGYRASWESVLGGMAPATAADNRGAWSGDHASVDPRAVPGFVVSNVRMETKNAGVEDLAPTILELLGLPVAAGFDGEPLAESP